MSQFIAISGSFAQNHLSMKKIFLTPLLLLFIVACSNSETSHDSNEAEDALPGSKVEALIDALEDDVDTLETKSEEVKQKADSLLKSI